VSYIPSIIGFLLLIALWVIAAEVVPQSVGPLYCIFTLETILLFWLLREALKK
jgi:hypothetical protein